MDKRKEDEPEVLSTDEQVALKKWYPRVVFMNWLAILAHVGVLIYMVVIGMTTNTTFIEVSLSYATDRPGLAPMSFATIGPANPRAIAAAFEGICLVAHLFAVAYTLPLIKASETNLNPYRWAEYSVSASLMFTGIQLVCGVTDLSAIASAFAVNFLVMWSGFASEVINVNVYIEEQTKRDPKYKIKVSWADWWKKLLEKWFPFMMGSLAAIGPWIGVWVSVLRTSAENPEMSLNLVFAIVGGLQGFFFLFAQWEFIYLSQYWPMTFWAREFGYNFLSVTAKVTLAVLIYQAVP